MPASTILLPVQPSTMSTAQLAAVSFLARYSGRTHALYTYQLKRWFTWCEGNGLDPLLGIKRAHVELYIGHLGDSGLMDSSIVTMMHGVRGYFRFAHDRMVLSVAEVEDLARCFDPYDDGIVVPVLANGGLRIGEALALQRSDVHLRDGNCWFQD